MIALDKNVNEVTSSASDMGGSNPSSAQPDCQVSPRISVAEPKIVLIAKNNVRPHRLAVELGVILPPSIAEFDGIGTLACNGDAVCVYAAAADGQALQLPREIPGGDLRNGVTLYVQGVTASAAVDDISLTLTLSGGTKRLAGPSSDTLTCASLTLDICAPRRTADNDPEPLAADRKIAPGRRIQCQPNQQYVAARARLFIRQAAPAALVASLKLRHLDDRVSLFEQEVAAADQQATATPYQVPNQHIVEVDQVRWVEGSAAGASGYALGLQELPDQEGDRVTINVQQVGAVRFIRCISDPTTEVDARDIGAAGNLSKMAKEVRLANRRANVDAAKDNDHEYWYGWEDGNEARACTMHIDGMTTLYSDIGYILEPPDSDRIHQYSWKDASAPTGLRTEDEVPFLQGLLDSVRQLWTNEDQLQQRVADSEGTWGWLSNLDGDGLGFMTFLEAREYINRDDTESNAKLNMLKVCLKFALIRCSDAIRRQSAQEYLLRRNQALRQRFSTYGNEARCSRGRCIERCLELIDMPANEFAGLQSGLKYNEVTIDVHRDIITGVFYTERDSERDKKDLLDDAQEPVDIDRNGGAWLQRKLVIARQLANLLDENRGGANPVTLYMLTGNGILQQQDRGN